MTNRRLALGSAQFGLDYGISNRTGRTPVDVARAIVERALSQGLDLIDTAPGYGVSEEVLGRILDELPLLECWGPGPLEPCWGLARWGRCGVPGS